MKDLSDSLLTAQRASSATPYVHCYLPYYGGGWDLSDYVKKVVETQQTYGSMLQVLLTDAATWFIAGGIPRDVKGQQVDLGWGFTISGTPEWELVQPYYVQNARLISAPGMLLVQFNCYDMWQRLQMMQVMGDSAGYAPEWNKDTTVFDIIEELLNGICDVRLDESDGIIDSYMPLFKTSITDSIAGAIARLLSYTNCGARFRRDGLHIYKLPENTDDAYQYNSVHVFRSHVWDDEPSLPNRILVVDKIPSEDGGMHTYEGTATDTESYEALGYYATRIYEVAWVTSDDEAQQIAEAILNSIQRERDQGILIVPIMNVGQEIGDVVTIDDPRY